MFCPRGQSTNLKYQTTENYSRNLILLNSDTVDIVEYVEKSIDKNKKNYNFWKLINND